MSLRSWRTRLQLALVDVWQSRGPAAWLLTPLSVIHWLVYRAIEGSYAHGFRRAKTLDRPVVVIGNLYVGGTGKTPLTIELSRALAARGWRPGIVSRGYGRKSRAAQLVGPDDSALDVGDEPLLLAQATGVAVAVGPSRVGAARALLGQHPECDLIIADDGLQHRALARDIEVAVVHYRGLGNHWLLPAGPLREPPARLDQVDFIVAHGDAPTLNTRPPLFRMSTRLTHARPLAESAAPVALAELAAQQQRERWTMLAAAGIGMPDRFFAMLRSAGLQFDEMPLADHYDFLRNPFSASRHDRILITEKDAVKCRRNPALAADPRLWVVPLQAELDPRLADVIDARLRARQKAQRGSPPA